MRVSQLLQRTVEASSGRLGILINNAAVASVPHLRLREQMRLAFDTNATGVAVIVDEFTSLLKRSSDPRTVNISSGLGSVTARLDPNDPHYNMSNAEYRATKSALNTITACQWVELKGEGSKIFSYCPGNTVSNMSSYNTIANGAKPTAESAFPLVKLIEGERDNEVERFLHSEGQYYW